MIDPYAYYRVWEQEHDDLTRKAAQHRARRESRSDGASSRPSKARGAGLEHRSWINQLGAGVLRVRKLLTV